MRVRQKNSSFIKSLFLYILITLLLFALIWIISANLLGHALMVIGAVSIVIGISLIIGLNPLYFLTDIFALLTGTAPTGGYETATSKRNTKNSFLYIIIGILLFLIGGVI